MRELLLGMVSLSLAGCAIHPSTEEFAKDSVPEIVHKIKCEARAAVLDTVPEPKSYLMGTGIGMLFTFDLEDNAGIGSEGSFAIPIVAGNVSLGYSVGKNMTRKSVQKIKLIATFDELANAADCVEGAPGPNHLYPITGESGIGVIFRNYANIMEESAHLSSPIEEFEDELSFTTKFSGSFKPEIKLSPVSKRNITIDNQIGADRTDDHSVKIVFTAVKSTYQVQEARAEAELIYKKKRKRELAELKENAKIPQFVQILDGEKRIIGPTAIGKGASHKGSGGATEIQPYAAEGADTAQTVWRGGRRVSEPTAASAGHGGSGRDSKYDILEATRQALERSEARAFQDRFRKVFEGQ